MHALHAESDRLQAVHAALARAHAGLVATLAGGAEPPPPLAQAVASRHERWLAYVEADCELAGTLTGAGGTWPSVHGLACQNRRIAGRTLVVGDARTCLLGVSPDSTYERYECLQGLVDWSLGDD